MSASSMGGGVNKQVIRPPQRGIFPLDHFADCKAPMDLYLQCLEDHKDIHHECRNFSRDYLKCRMDNGLMSQENLDQMGFSDDTRVKGAKEYDMSKEKEGFIAGKHISKTPKWWWQR